MKGKVVELANRILGTVGAELRKKVDVFEVQKSLLVRGSAATIFDVGASDGRVTKRYRALFDTARVICFEPDDARARSIRELRLENVEVVNKALSDSQGTAQFYVNADPDTSSLLPSVPIGGYVDRFTAPAGTISVATTTLDAYCHQHAIDRIDILKMDIQGGELAALRGALSLLTARKIGLIYLEVEFMELYADQPLYHHIAAFLASYGYELHGIFNLWSVERGRLAWADAIFVPAAPEAA
jgi:FkbM family methyltransferase